MVIVLVAVVLAAGVAAGVAFFVAGSRPAAAEQPKKEEHAAPGVALPLEEFVTNLQEPGALVRVKFALEVADEKQKEHAGKSTPALRDAILQELRQHKVAELRGPSGTELLRERVLARAVAILGKDAVRHVLVTDLVTQP